MRWKIRRGGHDPRQIDLLAVLVMIAAICATGHYLGQHPKPQIASALIEPSQTVRW